MNLIDRVEVTMADGQFWTVQTLADSLDAKPKAVVNALSFLRQTGSRFATEQLPADGRGRPRLRYRLEGE